MTKRFADHDLVFSSVIAATRKYVRRRNHCSQWTLDLFGTVRALVFMITFWYLFSAIAVVMSVYSGESRERTRSRSGAILSHLGRSAIASFVCECVNWSFV
ncbi:hypothetical protein LIPSTDRAFT_202097 [Lipomyces starkeyi NRRL Y-11557]|uniref:Uncharacterized protein n=1 Tax=Lipomyces starkeyi NRRL Y-11557 TaxID=675824 RepID=A0A1E3PUQ5_LIPST|nr:hypothetical protein LIPSTDRAFT_202097 [Lipomyces starkeyi NRRL Y-11557]